MNSHFNLQPDNESQQRLRLGRSLADIHYEAGFRDVIEPFGITVTKDDEIASSSPQELIIRPPIPPEAVEKFGLVMIEFAYSRERQGTPEIGFIDSTQGEEVVYWRQQPAGRRAR